MIEKQSLTIAETQAMLLHVAQTMVDNEPMLTEADRAIGDGDHGIGMARGFSAVKEKLTGQTFSTLSDLFKATGMALMSSMGGASGAIFGTWFRGGAKAISQKDQLDHETFGVFLQNGLNSIVLRGGAKEGDKTMIDALAPASQVANTNASASLTDLFQAVVNAAETGMEKTKTMVATTGRAKTLGERSLGHPDPGAISTYLIFKSMSEYLATDH